MREEKILLVIFVFTAFVLFFIKSFFFLDPDFGWHLKIGELILRSGIPSTDPFSYTMPSYPFVDHEWLSNVIIHLIYSKIGWFWLAVLYSVIPLVALLIQVLKLPSKNRIILFVFSALAIAPFVGVRTQTETILFFSILTAFFIDKRIYQRFRIFIPFLFLIWANLHGGFAIGIVIFSLFLGLKFFKEKKVLPTDLGLLIASILATFINPYGWRLWWEVWMQITDTSLRWTIQEWTPAFLWFLPQTWIYIIFSLVLVIKYRNKFGLFSKAFYFSMLIAGLSSIRHMFLWAILAIPITSEGVSFLRKESEKFSGGKRRLIRAQIFVIALSIFSFCLVSFPFSKSSSVVYPTAAIDYLKLHPSSGHMFSEHGWGGYLIWKYPQKKVFVDGRMNSWRREQAPANESTYAFRDYLDFYNGKILLNKIVKKYNIDTFLIPTSNGQSLPFSKKGSYGTISQQLKKNNWKIVYKDEVAVIYRK